MKSKSSTTVGLWSFIFVISISFLYLNDYVWNKSEENLIFTGGYVITFFLFLAGYYLMKNYKESKDKKSPLTKAWQFLLMKIKKYYFLLLSGTFLAFVIRNLINATRLTDLFPLFINSLWEFLGLSQIGITNYINIKSLSFTPIFNTSYLWNYPLWIGTACLISCFILYYIVSSNEEFFVAIFVPFLLIITYANFNLNSIGFDIGTVNSLGIPSGLMRVMSCISVGMLLYLLVNFVKKIKLSENIKLFLSFLHMFFAIFFLYTIYAGIMWSELTNSLLVLIFLFILLLDKDYISALYNRSNVCKFLGNLSVYYYSYFIIFIFLIEFLFPSLNYNFSIIFNLLFTLGFSFIMMMLNVYVIKPLFNKN